MIRLQFLPSYDKFLSEVSQSLCICTKTDRLIDTQRCR